METKLIIYSMLDSIKKISINEQNILKYLYDTVYINELEIEKEFYNIFNVTFFKAKKILNIKFKSSLLRYDIKKIFIELNNKLIQNNIYLPSFIKKIKKVLPQEIDIIEDNIDYKLIIKKDNFNCLNINIIKYIK